jgi:hypothetical protein
MHNRRKLGSDTSGHKGENALVFNFEDKAWYGLFVDNHGRVHALKGAVTPGFATLEGPGRDAAGKAILRKNQGGAGERRQCSADLGEVAG